jgi:glutathione S-transferase
MKPVVPRLSPFTRRVGLTLNLLDMPFEHVALHAFEQKDEVKRFNAMGRVPILVLGDRETLIDSSIIADYLEE